MSYTYTTVLGEKVESDDILDTYYTHFTSAAIRGTGLKAGWFTMFKCGLPNGDFYTLVYKRFDTVGEASSEVTYIKYELQANAMIDFCDSLVVAIDALLDGTSGNE